MTQAQPDPSASRLRAFLFTDASYCEKTGAGGWAACMIEGALNRVMSGPASKNVTSSSGAEWFALGMGIKAAVQAGFIRRDMELVVSVDHVALLQVERMASRGSGVAKAVALYVEKISKDVGFTLTMQHVKAHVRAERRDEFQKINAVVDSVARSVMIARKQEIRADQAVKAPRILEDLSAHQGLYGPA